MVRSATIKSVCSMW